MASAASWYLDTRIWPLQNDWFKDLGMVVTLFGVVTLLCGWQVMKTAWFPIAFLVCAALARLRFTACWPVLCRKWPPASLFA